jgi:HEAT repeat protein
MKKVISILIMGACLFSVYLVTKMRLTPPAADEVGKRQQVKATITQNSNFAARAVTQDQHLASMRLRSENTDLRKHEMEPRIQTQPQSDTNSLAGIIQILQEQSNDPHADSKRFAAAQRLRNLGVSVNEGLPVFRDLLHNADSTLAFSGARALAFISESSPEAFAELSNALSDLSPVTRVAATHGLGIIFNEEAPEPKFEDLIPSLVLNVRDSDQTVRADTINTLWQYIDAQHRGGLSAQIETVLPALTQSLDDAYPPVRLNALLAIREFGPHAQSAAPQVERLLNAEDSKIRAEASRTLAAIRGK